jgi:hypothetical protein
MIQANELRIGNWVLAFDGIQYQVEAGDFQFMYRYTMNPIPLTPEVMERVDGCLSKPYNDTYELAGLVIDYNGPKKSFWIQGVHHINVISTLHHLQNLIHALTGVEITYNP